MKKIIVVLAATLSLFGFQRQILAQGQIQFDSLGLSFPAPTTTGRVFDTDTTTPLSGSGFTAQLWGHTTNDRNVFQLLETKVGFESGGDAGRISVFAATTTPFAGGSALFYEIRAWNNSAGSITSFDSATTRGVSSIASRTLTTSPSTPNFTDNFANFSLVVVPEPSTIALGLIGGAALLLRRRRHS